MLASHSSSRKNRRKLALEELHDRIAPSAGALDLVYGADGVVETDFGRNEQARAHAIQPDGKIVVVGLTGFGTDVDFAIARYKVDGSLDTTFGNGGKVTTSFGTGADIANDVVIQPNGQILVVGGSNRGSQNDFALARYNSDGTLDASFGTNGKVLRDNGGDDYATAVTLIDDNPVVVGSSNSIGRYSFVYNYYGPTGILFLQNLLNFNSTSNDLASDVVIDPLGKVVIGGTSTIDGVDRMTLAAVTLSGQPITSYGPFSTGFTIEFLVGLDTGLRGLATGPNGSIWAVGYQNTNANNRFAIAAFGDQGNQLRFQNLDFGPGDDQALGITFRSDGTPVAVGYSTASGGNKNFALTDFAGNNVTFDLGSNDDVLSSVSRQQDGKLVAVGHTTNSTYDFALARLNANLSLDKTMADGTGTVVNDLGSNLDVVNASVFQADGKLVVVGSSGSNLAVARYLVDGTLDPTFDGDGILTRQLNGIACIANQVAIDADGKIVIGASNGNVGSTDFAIIRLNANGTLDTTFNGTGFRITNVGADDYLNGLVIQGDGAIIVAGVRGQDSALVRYTSAGALDTSFDGDGILVSPAPEGAYDAHHAVTIDGNGRIVTSGISFTGTSFQFKVNRYNSSGSADTTFDGDGYATVDIGPSPDFVNAMAIQSDGKIVLAGRTSTGTKNQFALARFNTNGSLDYSFNDDGLVTTNFGPLTSGFDATINSLTLQPDGKIIAVGSAWNGSNDEIAVARYTIDGSPDSTFDSDGKLTISASSGGMVGRSVRLASNGRIVIAGHTVNGGVQDFFVTRLLNDNRAPSNGSDTQSLNEDSTLSGNVNASDPDGDVVTTTLVSPPQFGRATLTPSGAFSYLPNANYFGTDSFTYTITDSRGLTSNGVMNLNIAPVNDAPRRIAGTIRDLIVPTGSPLLGLGLDSFDYSPGAGESDVLTYRITALPSAIGTVYLNDGTTVVAVNTSYTLSQLQGMQILINPSPSGSTGSFAWTVDDGNGGTLPQTMNVKIASVSLTDVPAVVTTVPGHPVQFDASATTSNVPGSSHRFSLLNAPAGAVINPDTGEFSWTPDGGTALASYSITVRAEDKSNPTAFATMTSAVDVIRVAIISNGLHIGGTNGNDTISISRNATSGEYRAQLGTAVVGIYAPGSFDYIMAYGVSGNDTITISPTITFSANLFGGSGNDRLTGGSGTNSIFAEDGNDTITGSSANEVIDGGAGNDRITTGAGTNTVYGGDGNDTITGGVANDFIFGGDGNDFVNGGAGTNVLYGEDGNDTITGGVANDFIYGGDGNDFVNGGAGNNELYGEDGNDTITGGIANDSIFGGAGNDRIIGSNGNNYLNGGDGNDTLTGGTGRDVMVGGLGLDILSGSSGEDLLIGGRVSFGDSGYQPVLNEWFSTTTSFIDRVDHIEGTVPGGLNGTTVINSTTATDDGAVDTLFGGTGSDYFVHSSTDLLDNNVSDFGFLVV